MLAIVIGLLAVAALGGATMAFMRFRGKATPPIPLALLHGVLAASGLVLLLLEVWPEFSGSAAWALAIFVLAAFGGLTLAVGFHRRGKPLPSAAVVAHGALALLAFLILLAAAAAAM